MTKYLLAIIAVICAFAFTSEKESKTLFDYYYTDDYSTWHGANSIAHAKSLTQCDENQDEFCADVYEIDRLVMDGETVIGVAEQPGGGPFPPNVVLEWPARR